MAFSSRWQFSSHTSVSWERLCLRAAESVSVLGTRGQSLRETSCLGLGVCPHRGVSPGATLGEDPVSDFDWLHAHNWSPSLRRGNCHKLDRIPECPPKETLPLVHGNQLSYVQ